MKIPYILFFYFLSALMDQNTSVLIHQKKEGTNFKIQWDFQSSESTKFICKTECKDDLNKSAENRIQSDRFSTEYKNSSSARGVFYVNIRNLTKSDSGRYSCSLEGSQGFYRDFAIKVVDVQEEEINIHTGDNKGKASVACYFSSSNSTKFFCKGECKDGNVLIETTDDRAQKDRYSITYQQVSVRNKFLLRVSITGLNESDSGQYTCGLGESLSSASFQKFEISVINDTGLCISSSVPSASTSSSDVFSSAPPKTTNWFTALVLPVIVCVPVVIGLMTVVLLCLHRLKANKEPESRNMDVTLIAVTYENDSFLHSYSNGDSVEEAAPV